MKFRHSLNMAYPYIQYQYGVGDETYVTVDFLVPAFCKDQFEVILHPNKREIHLKIKLITKFFEMNRIRNQDKNKFNRNSHKVIAFQSCSDAVKKECNNSGDIFGNTPPVQLPFEVDENSVEADVFLHKHPELTEVFKAKNLKHRGYYAIFTVTYEALLKRKTPKKAVTISVCGFSDDEVEEKTPISEVKTSLDFSGEMDEKVGKITDSHRKRLKNLKEIQENKKKLKQNNHDLLDMDIEYDDTNLNFIGPVPKVPELVEN